MRDFKFLDSLGLREEVLRPQPEPQPGERGRDPPPVLPTAGPRGLPAELLSLSEAELEKLFKEDTPRKTPMCLTCPTASKAAVYPDKTLGEYDLEWPANQFISLVALARNPDIEGMLAYKPRHRRWHTVDPNPSQEVEDLLLWLEDDDRNTVTQSKRRQQHDIHDAYGVE